MPTDPTFEVVDRRKRGYFTVDNVLLDVYGAQLGPYGIAVYCCLARFADADSECWPTYRTISNRTGVSRSQVIRELAKLETLGIISITQRFTEKGDRRSHLFTLLDIVGGGSTVEPGGDSSQELGGSTVEPRKRLKKKDPGPKNQKREYIPDEYADIIIH